MEVEEQDIAIISSSSIEDLNVSSPSIGLEAIDSSYSLQSQSLMDCSLLQLPAPTLLTMPPSPPEGLSVQTIFDPEKEVLLVLSLLIPTVIATPHPKISGSPAAG